MKILVTFAVGSEFLAWRRKGHFRLLGRNPFPLYAGEIHGSDVRVLLTGIGGQRAVEGIRWAMRRATDVCISSGFAGALRRDLFVGEVLASRVACRGGSDMAVASDAQLFAAACEAGANPVDRFVTVRNVVARAADKLRLSAEADAAEMESYDIMAEAARHGVRALTVRVVSDSAASSLPLDFGGMLNARGAVRPSRLLAELIRKPDRIAGLWRLARDCSHASNEIAAFLDRYLLRLSVSADRSKLQMVAAT